MQFLNLKLAGQEFRHVDWKPYKENKAAYQDDLLEQQC